MWQMFLLRISYSSNLNKTHKSVGWVGKYNLPILPDHPVDSAKVKTLIMKV